MYRNVFENIYEKSYYPIKGLSIKSFYFNN